MSVTFSVEGATLERRACPKCGANYPNMLDNDCEYVDDSSREGRCYGMGFSYSSSPEMNVANGNASLLLSALGVEPDYCGSLDPRDVLVKLASLKPENHTRKTLDNQGIDISENGVRSVVRMISFGATTEQVSRYLDSLTAIAQAAIDKGARITWG